MNEQMTDEQNVLRSRFTRISWAGLPIRDWTAYACGFMFTTKRDYVMLIKKKRPDWQAGLFNGVGGKLEKSDDTALACMIREFQEETGILHEDWRPVIKYVNPNYKGVVYFFDTAGEVPIEQFEGTGPTDEDLAIIPTTSIPTIPTLQNLKWIIPMMVHNQISFPIEIHERLRGANDDRNPPVD